MSEMIKPENEVVPEDTQLFPVAFPVLAFFKLYFQLNIGRRFRLLFM